MIVSLLLAMNIILKRLLVIRLPFDKFSFNFVPVMLCAIILGTKYTVLLEVLSDILGCLLFPRGAFFIGYTISAMVVGFIHGGILYPRNGKVSCQNLLPKLILSTLLVALVVSIGLNTIWRFYTTNISLRILFPEKVAKQIVMVPLRVVTMYYTVELLESRLNKIMY